MAICAIAIQQADGSYLLGLDPTVTNPSACAYVVETGAESVIGSLGSLTIDEASIIGGAVWALWAICFGIKQVARSLLNPTEGNENE